MEHILVQDTHLPSFKNTQNLWLRKSQTHTFLNYSDLKFLGIKGANTDQQSLTKTVFLIKRNFSRSIIIIYLSEDEDGGISTEEEIERILKAR